MAGLKFPKPVRKVKVRKWLRRKTPIKRCKGSAKPSDNGKRKPRRPAAETEAWTLQKRREKLADLSPAQLALGAILRDFGISFEYEWIWPNGDYPYFSDIYIPSHKLTIECDGDFHRYQKKADIGKAMYIARNFAVGTKRFWNRECLDGSAANEIRQMLLGGNRSGRKSENIVRFP